jgi:hypothetical protein
MLNINCGGVLGNQDPEMRRRVAVVARLANMSAQDALKVILQLSPGTFRLKRLQKRFKTITTSYAKAMGPFSLN